MDLPSFKDIPHFPELVVGRYMQEQKQKDIRCEEREILVDWMIKVAKSYSLHDATIFLGVQIMDRYCQHQPIIKTQYQLVGITSLLLASKYEDVVALTVNDAVYLIAKQYGPERVMAMEVEILTALEFRISYPTTYTFLIPYIHRGVDMTGQRSLYYATLLLQEHDVLAYPPSLVAAAILYMAFQKDMPDAEEIVETVTGIRMIRETTLPITQLLTDRINTPVRTVEGKTLECTYKRFQKIKNVCT